MKALLRFVLVVSLTACAAPVVEGAYQARDYSKRAGLEQKATAGDAAAQYELGQSYCCVVTGQTQTAASVYDNGKATYWLCRAAHQDYGPAQLKLARIYSGDLIEGVRLMKRAAGMFAGRKTDPGVALMWARLAARNNIEDATDLKNDLQSEATSADLERADRLSGNWRSAPCEWTEVFTAG